MPLVSGTKLGPYEIVAPLGAGGMGEVYRANDTRLDRTVAIKILPEHLAGNNEAKQRFEREARSISSLNHPNICALYDVGSQDGISYLVMEFLQGETLEARLLRGPVPVKQVLEIGAQICDALEKAHRAGIVHRDLKPGNIMLTPGGAKLLDFGLAKPVASMLGQTSGRVGEHTPSSPTINMTAPTATPQTLTQQGSIVGTFQFMAPEVLQGQEADARSDIFSLGCVLYEMITSKRAFEGKSQISVMSAILEKDPEPIATLQPAAPPALDYVVETCLEKDPGNRYQTAHDVKLQLAWIAKSGSQTSAAAIAPVARKKGWLWPAAAAAALVLLAIGAVMWPAHKPWPVLKTNLLPPPGTQFETLYRNGAPALSPDGTRVVFVAQKDARNSLWLRQLDKVVAAPLPGTDGAFAPFWSPDGNSVGFFTNGKLWRMDLNGGAPIAICDAMEARGGTWGKGDVIIFAPDPAGPLWLVSANGGAPTKVTGTSTGAGALSDRWPHFLPDGKHFLFLHSPNGDAEDDNEIRFASIDGGAEQVVQRGHFYTFQYASGWLIAALRGALDAWKFEESTGTVLGQPVQLVDKIAADEITGSGVFSVSPQGLLLYQEASGATGDRHVWVDAAGKQIAQISELSIYGSVRLSPDGERMATPMVRNSGEDPLWVWSLNGGARAPLTSGKDSTPEAVVWSADGRTIYFARIDNKGSNEVWRVPADGSQPEKALLHFDNGAQPTDTTSDGKWLLYEEHAGDSPRRAALKAYPLVTGMQPFTVLNLLDWRSNARLVPGRNDWLVYQSSESGRSEIYLTTFPRSNARFQVTRAGATQPTWSRDGKNLYYLDDLQRMTVVPVQVGKDSVQVGSPRTLFPTGIRHSIPNGGYDVARDGRFLLVSAVVDSTAPIVLVTNWQALTKK
jgi:Tol biopolymer transport system component